MNKYISTLTIAKGAIYARITIGGHVVLMDEYKHFMSEYMYLGQGSFSRVDKTERTTHIW